MKKGKKNIVRLLSCKKRLFLFLFFIPAICGAQSDTLLADTLGPVIIEEKVEAPPAPVDKFEKIYDSVYQEAVPDYYDEEDEDDEEDRKEYFLYKWEIEDSFTVLQRQVPDDHIRKMQQDDVFWYANSDIEIEKPKQEKKSNYVPLGKRKWFQSLLWIVIIGSFAAFVAIYLSGNNVGLFRKKAEGVNHEVDEDKIPEDIFAINYQKEIDKASANNNYRLAIRLMFLRLLKQLTERNIIQYKHDRTNFDYLMQLQSTSYYNHFFRITRNYEYSWYGKFPVNEEAFNLVRKDFAQFDRQLY